MKNLLLSLSFFAALGVSGCRPQYEIGGECESTADCVGGLQCATNFPDGYCSRDCTYDSKVCAPYTACVSVGKSTTYECYRECSGDSSCRTGYHCVPVSGLADAKGICLPR